MFISGKDKTVSRHLTIVGNKVKTMREHLVFLWTAKLFNKIHLTKSSGVDFCYNTTSIFHLQC